MGCSGNVGIFKIETIIVLTNFIGSHTGISYKTKDMILDEDAKMNKSLWCWAV